MNRSKLTRLFTLIGLASLPLAFGTKAFPAEKEFGIGVLAPTTGAFAGLGEDMVAGIKEFLAEHKNSIAGRPVKLYVADTQLDADMAVQQAQKASEPRQSERGAWPVERR